METTKKLPEWVKEGVKFCLLDFRTMKPTKVTYTVEKIDYTKGTITLPEMTDYEGSHECGFNSVVWWLTQPIENNESNN